MAASPATPRTLPLRADVLLSASLFDELEDGISEEFFQRRAGGDLSSVASLELRVDSTRGQECVESIGELLPNLRLLRLSQSTISTVRELGTSLSNLRVLWLGRCSLQDLGGISVLRALEELYAPFNDVQNLADIGAHESLRILDVEGNLIEEPKEIGALEGVATLQELNVIANPVWRCEGFTRQRVLQVLSQVEVLDDVPRNANAVTSRTTVGASEDADTSVEFAEIADLLCTPQHASFQNLDGGPRVGDEDSGRALAMLHKRSQCTFGSTVAAESPRHHDLGVQHSSLRTRGTRAPCATERWSAGGPSQALAALRDARLQLVATAATPVDFKDASDVRVGAAEPSERELVVEGLRRARARVPSLSLLSGDYVPDSLECGGGALRFYCCAKRAWEASSSSSSASCRPTTAGSAATSRSSAWSTSAAGEYRTDLDATASDLTVGDDGAVLAGNPLDAVRRKRRSSSSTGEQHDIRRLIHAARSEPEPWCGFTESDGFATPSPIAGSATSRPMTPRRRTSSRPMTPRLPREVEGSSELARAKNVALGTPRSASGAPRTPRGPAMGDEACPDGDGESRILRNKEPPRPIVEPVNLLASAVASTTEESRPAVSSSDAIRCAPASVGPALAVPTPLQAQPPAAPPTRQRPRPRGARPAGLVADAETSVTIFE